MAKDKSKLTELPKLEDWKAPWEVDAEGKEIAVEEQEIDQPRLKKYLYGLLGDKLKLQKDVEETTTRAEELEDKVAKAADPAQLTALQEEVVKTQKERDDAATAAKNNQGSALEVLKLRVALRKGLSETQAKRLLGTNEEELEQDAEELLASFGGTGTGAEGEGEGGTIRTTPRRNLRTAGDPNPDAEKDKEEIDPDKWAQEQYAVRRGRR